MGDGYLTVPDHGAFEFDGADFFVEGVGVYHLRPRPLAAARFELALLRAAQKAPLSRFILPTPLPCPAPPRAGIVLETQEAPSRRFEAP